MRVATTIALGALVAASSAAAQQRATGSGIKVSKDEVVTPKATTTPSSSVTVTSNGTVTVTPMFDIGVYANQMNEKNITAHMAAGDSTEIQIARLAQTKATDARVRDYATMLLNDHTAHLPKVIEVITDEHVGAEPMANDPEGMRMKSLLTHLGSMAAGSAWDATFLRSQVEHHQHEIEILNANIKNAHDDDLEELIKASLGSLAKHRDTGKSVATQIGVSLQ